MVNFQCPATLLHSFTIVKRLLQFYLLLCWGCPTVLLHSFHPLTPTIAFSFLRRMSIFTNVLNIDHFWTGEETKSFMTFLVERSERLIKAGHYVGCLGAAWVVLVVRTFHCSRSAWAFREVVSTKSQSWWSTFTSVFFSGRICFLLSSILQIIGTVLQKNFIL